MFCMVTLFKLLRNTIVRFLSQLFILIGMSDVVERLSWAGFPPVVLNVHPISAGSEKATWPIHNGWRTLCHHDPGQVLTLTVELISAATNSPSHKSSSPPSIDFLHSSNTHTLLPQENLSWKIKTYLEFFWLEFNGKTRVISATLINKPVITECFPIIYPKANFYYKQYSIKSPQIY